MTSAPSAADAPQAVTTDAAADLEAGLAAEARPASRWFVRCAVTPAERAVRAVAAVIVGAVAVQAFGLGNLFCAIPAALCATFLTIGAITGWCPTSLLALRQPRTSGGNAFGIPEAPQKVTLPRR